MKILAVHNRYQQAGGEDSVFRNEIELLRSGGHDVAVLEENNDRIKGTAAQIAAAAHAVWSRYGQRRMAEAIIRVRPDVVHVHNFFPTLSPAIFWTCGEHRVPAVWTLHNFRVACANGLLFRDGQVCEKCLGASPLPAIRHGCYRGSRAASAAVAAMIATHRTIGTWRYKVDRFIALTDFARDKVIAAGLPADRVVVKPNFVPAPEGAPLDARQRAGFLFVGRLSPEKGVRMLVEAWRGDGDLLTIVGDGPDAQQLRKIAPGNVRFTGHLEKGALSRLMARSLAIIVPSLWYETFGMTAVEAMANGTPVIAARIGGPASFVEEGISGSLFEPGNRQSLIEVVRNWPREGQRLQRLIEGSRAAFEHRFSPRRNLSELQDIYAAVIRAGHGA
jgi:glycosyltransferase involved in cell wall biosynthesis